MYLPLYLPWLPLTDPNAFKLEITQEGQDGGLSSDDSVSILITTENYGNAKADIYKTSVCPLAKVMRTELKKRGVKKLKVLFSTETPIKQEGQRIPASISFVPSVAGLIIAGEVVRELIK